MRATKNPRPRIPESREIEAQQAPLRPRAAFRQARSRRPAGRQ